MERKFFIAEIETCSDMMYRVAWSILRNDADVQDALQDAALKAWEKRDKLRDEKFFRTWITRILINACYDTQRKRRRMISRRFRKTWDTTPQRSPSIAMAMSRKRCVRKAQTGCRPSFRVWLKKMEEKHKWVK